MAVTKCGILRLARSAIPEALAEDYMKRRDFIGREIPPILLALIWFVLGLLVTTTLAQAEDMASMISQYRRAHGLSGVSTDARLTGIAERQARAMAGSGVMGHGVAGPFAARIAGANAGLAGENIAAGTKSFAETFRLWRSSAGHNANLLLPGATRVGIAVAYGGQTRNKAFWAMEIAGAAENRRLRRRP
jgi:uncharacterized protein YkwD